LASAGKDYKYENFDDLKEELFLEPEDEEGSGMTQPNLAFEAGYQSYIHLANGGDQFATPIAPLAKRTKQEIKSGLRPPITTWSNRKDNFTFSLIFSSENC
jgi:hypothetical protein